MRTTIDAAGRVVVPQPMRDELGLVAGTEIEIRVVDRRIEIEVPATPTRGEDAPGRPVERPDPELSPLTVDVVRETLERTRR